MTWQGNDANQPVNSGQPVRRVEVGQDVFSSDGRRVGTVGALEPNAIVVTRGPLTPPERVIPEQMIHSVDGQGVHLSVPLEQLQAVGGTQQTAKSPTTGGERTLELERERLVSHTARRLAGDVELHTVVEEVPARLQVETTDEEVVAEHVSVGREVRQREQPREENGVLIIPVYEERLEVVKRLVLKEEVRVRRVRRNRPRTIEETVRRERLEVRDPDHTGLVHERGEQPD